MTDVALERQFTVQEVAHLWGRSHKFVRSLFEKQPGVSVVMRGRFCTFLIPESVVVEVHRKMRAA